MSVATQAATQTTSETEAQVNKRVSKAMAKIVDRQSLKDHIAKSAEGYPLIGWYVYWSITNVKVRYTDLIRIMQAIGLNTDAATKIRPRSAFTSALNEIERKYKGKKALVLDDKDRVGYVISTVTPDPVNVDATFTTETRAVLNKHTYQVTVTGPYEQEFLALHADFLEHYYSDEFREMILRLLRLHCQFLTIRDRGGVYFVPASSAQGLELIKKLFAQFPECVLDCVGIADMADARKSMWKTMIGEVTSDLQAMKDDLASLDSETREDNLQIRLQRYQTLREKVENYEIVLRGTAQDLKDELAGLTKAIRSKLVG